MKTQAEHFPNELWLSVFSYLEAHDLFHGFANLNHRFNRLLASTYLTFYVELNKQNDYDDQHPSTTYWLDKILKRIVCLQLTAQSGYEDIPRYLRKNAHKLIQLQSLTITMDEQQTYLICLILIKVRLVEYLSITCKKIPILIKTILDLTTLRVLQLNLMKSKWYNWYSLKVNDNIQTFYINFQGLSDHRMTNLLLSKMSNLKRFTISSNKYNRVNLEKSFAQPMLNLPTLRIIKIIGGFEYLLPSYLNYLQKTMPFLRQLHMDIRCNIMNEKLFDHLVYCWWPFLNKLENIHIQIIGYISGDFSTQSDKYWTILLAKNNESDNCFRIQWKSYLQILSLVKLTIQKTKKNRIGE